MKNKRTMCTAAWVLMLALVLVPAALTGAGTSEVEARNLQFTDRYAALDLPYASQLSLRDTILDYRYDFIRQGKGSYRFSERLTSSETDPVGGREVSSSQRMEAVMTFSQNGMGFADIIYTDISSTVSGTLRDRATGKTLSVEPPALPAEIRHLGLTPAGTFNIDDYLDFSYLVQFPIGSREIVMGKSFVVDLPLPVQLADGSKAYARGALKLTYAGNASISGMNYAKLLAEITLATDHLPQPIADTGQYHLSGKGYGVYYFSITDKNFFYGNVILDIRLETPGLVPQLSKFRAPAAAVPNRIVETSLAIRYERIR